MPAANRKMGARRSKHLAASTVWSAVFMGGLNVKCPGSFNFGTLSATLAMWQSA